MGDKFWIAMDSVLGLEVVNLGGCRKVLAPSLVTQAVTDLAEKVKGGLVHLADLLAWDASYGHD